MTAIKPKRTNYLGLSLAATLAASVLGMSWIDIFMPEYERRDVMGELDHFDELFLERKDDSEFLMCVYHDHRLGLPGFSDDYEIAKMEVRSMVRDRRKSESPGHKKENTGYVFDLKVVQVCPPVFTENNSLARYEIIYSDHKYNERG